MNALLRAAPELRTMLAADLDDVLAVEVLAYEFPWTRDNFIDSLAAGYLAEVLQAPDVGLLGYYVALAGVDELHLLNLTVAPAHQGQGHGQRLLDRVEQRCIDCLLPSLWLEVRASNERAQSMYRRRGFAAVGLRRNYYPAPQGRREDAVLMSRPMSPLVGHALD